MIIGFVIHEDTLFLYCRVQKQISGNGLGVLTLKKTENHIKKTLFSYGKIKHVPDLLEAIMRPTDPVKEELRPNLFKTTQFDPK